MLADRNNTRAVHQIGEIPPLLISPHEARNFRVVPSGGADDTSAGLSVEVNGSGYTVQVEKDSGVVAIQAMSGQSLPAKATFKLNWPDGVTQQSVMLETSPGPITEAAMIIHRSSPPEASDPRVYLQVAETGAAGARDIRISGVIVELTPNSAQFPLFDRLTGRTDLATVEIQADTVRIHGPLALPGASLTIRARRLEFLDDGAVQASIDTSPRADPIRATDDNGAKGRNGGTVTLWVDQIAAEGNVTRISAVGANGQGARLGEAGNPGKSVAAWNRKLVTSTSWSGKETLTWPAKDFEPYTVIGGEKWEYFWGRAAGFMDAWRKEGTFGSDTFPTDGHPPKVLPGRPGPGGDGGSVSGLHLAPLRGHINNTPGQAGALAEDIAGAKAGTPRKSMRIKARWESFRAPPFEAKKSGDGLTNRRRSTETIKKVETKNGAAAIAKGVAAKTKQPANGAINGLSGTWLSAGGLRALLQYLRDAFIANAEEDARALAQLYLAEIAQAELTQITLISSATELRNLVEKIDSPLDFFGRPGGWVPMLSFEANLERYETQIDSGIRALFLSDWIAENQESSAAAAKGLQTAVALLQAEAADAMNTLRVGEVRLADVESRVNAVEVELASLADDLRNMEHDLSDIARADLDLERKLRAAGNVLGAVMQLIPAGQPALGIVGKGVTVFADMDFEKPLDSLPKFAGIGVELAAVALKPKLKTLMSKLSPDEDKKPKDKDKDKFDAEVKKAELKKKVASHIKAQADAKSQITSAFSSLSIPEDELAAALAKIAAETPAYKDLTKKIADATTRQGQATADLIDLLATISEATATIMSARVAQIDMRADLDQSLAQLNPSARLAAVEMGRRARDRLLKYQYQLVASFQYLMVAEASAIDFSIGRLFDAFKDIIATSTNGQLSAAQVDGLRSVFEAQLIDLTDDILDWFSKHGPKYERTVFVALDAAQLADLNGATRTVDINLFDMGYLDPDIEDARISAIEVLPEVKISNPENHKGANVSLSFIHSGEGLIRRGGQVWRFRTGEPSQARHDHQGGIRSDAKNWSTDIGLVGRENPVVTNNVPDPAEESLIKHLIGRRTKTTSSAPLLNFEPPAWAQLTIRKSATPRGFDGEVQSLTIAVKLVAHQVAQDIATVTVNAPHAGHPFISIDAPDLGGRYGGRGLFQRSFDRRTQTKVTLAAPRHHAGRVFLGWRINRQDPETPGTGMMPILTPQEAARVGDAASLVQSLDLVLDLKTGADVDAVYARV